MKWYYINKINAKAIHICNSHQPTHKPKIAKEYVYLTAEKEMNKERKHNNGYSA